MIYLQHFYDKNTNNVMKLTRVNFFFELITPSKNLISGEFDMVVVPGEEGDFGVLPSHSNLISQIRPGVLDTYKNNKIDKSLSKCCQRFMNFQELPQISEDFDEF